MTESNDGPGMYWLRKQTKNGFFSRLKTRFSNGQLTDEDLERIKKAAWELSNIFDYHELARYHLGSRESGTANPIDGFLVTQYPHHYRTLIFDHRVIDLACLYALRKNVPPKLIISKLDSLKNWKKSIIFFKDYVPLHNFKKIHFNKIIVYTKEQNFYDAVQIEHNAEIEIKEWFTTGKKIKFSGVLFSLIDTDTLLVIMKDAPGTLELFSDFYINDENIKKEVISILTKALHKKETEIAIQGKQLNKAEEFVEGLLGIFSDTVKESNNKRINDLNEKIKQETRKRKEAENPEQPIIRNWTPIFLTIIIGIVVLSALGIIAFLL